jgi:pimeloyl-ACP methyl ester carboxylesterase
VLAAVNGVLGDYLAESGNPLAIEMRLRSRGRPLELEKEALRLALPRASGKLLVLVHGSCMNDLRWTRLGHDHGAALARDLGFTPVCLHYNSGLHISENGRAFAALLEALVATWPAPIGELVIVAHSMGGLVSRSACHAWRRKLRKLVCLGSPRRTARARGPLGRPAPRHQQVQRPHRAPREDPQRRHHRHAVRQRPRRALEGPRPLRARTPLELPAGVACYAIAATKGDRAAGRCPSDGLVPVDSALGRHPRPGLTLAFPEAHQWIARGVDHFELLSSVDVYATLCAWLSSRA